MSSGSVRFVYMYTVYLKVKQITENEGPESMHQAAAVAASTVESIQQQFNARLTPGTFTS